MDTVDLSSRTPDGSGTGSADGGFGRDEDRAGEFGGAAREGVGVRRDRDPLWRDLIGEVLRRERQSQDRTLQDVADEARISMPYLSELERGRKEASSEILAAAARALGLRLSDLINLAYSRLGEYETYAQTGYPQGTYAAQTKYPQSASARQSVGVLGSREAVCLAA